MPYRISTLADRWVGIQAENGLAVSISVNELCIIMTHCFAQILATFIVQM